METMSNYAKINKYDIANGPGVRISVFLSGCEHYCKGCFNSEAWDFNYGKPFTDETIQEIVNAMKPDYIKGITILGGEPMHPRNIETLYQIVSSIKNKYPKKTIWVYTGYTLEDLLDMDDIYVSSCLVYIDVLVDGRFMEELKDLTLRFKGSSNQRIIDVQETMKTDGKDIVLWQDWQEGKKGII